MVSFAKDFFLDEAEDHHRLFIIDGVISLPIALAGYFILPDVPETSRAFYFSKEVCKLPFRITQKGVNKI